MNRLVTAAALAIVCAPIVAACSDSSAATPPSTTTQLPTSPSTTPTVSTPPPPTVSLPTLPPPAEQRSIAGAKAFVRFFTQEMNLAWSTTRTERLRKLFGRGCVSCRDIATGIDGIRQEKGQTEGALWSIRGLSSIPLQPETRPIIHAVIETSPGRWKESADSSWRRLSKSTNQWDFRVVWIGASWVVMEATSR